MSLQLVADQCARAESEAAADRRTRSRMSHRRADESACRRPAKGADASAFFSRAQRTARAARDEERPCQYQYRCVVMQLHNFFLSTFCSRFFFELLPLRLIRLTLSFLSFSIW